MFTKPAVLDIGCDCIWFGKKHRSNIISRLRRADIGKLLQKQFPIKQFIKINKEVDPEKKFAVKVFFLVFLLK